MRLFDERPQLSLAAMEPRVRMANPLRLVALALAAMLLAQPVAKADESDVTVVPELPIQTFEDASDSEALIELPMAPAVASPGASDEETSATPPSDDLSAVTGASDALRRLRVLFPEDGIGIDPADEPDLAGLAGYLKQNRDQRIVLQAYVGGEDRSGSDARRLSLSRALAIRTFLVDRGVPAERVHLQPLGKRDEDGPPDRVDILPLHP